MESFKMQDQCNAKRHFGTVISNDKGINFYKSLIMKDAIVNAIKGNVRKHCKSSEEYGKKVLEYMMTRYSEPEFQNYQQKQAQLLFDWHKVMRYLKWEQRAIFIPEAKEVEFAGKKFLVKPDLAYSLNSNDIEIIFLKPGKLQMMKNKEDLERDVKVYLGILYAKSLGYTEITVSFYHLTKENESGLSEWKRYEQSFSGSNILRVKDSPLLGRTFEPEEIEALENFVLTGTEKEECDKDCIFCPLKAICNYTLPATKKAEIVAMDKEAEDVVGKVSKPEITYTDQQQKVIDFTKGVCRVVAAAGSGKTQTVAARVAKLIDEGVKPEEILCITFSNSGVKEMRRKIGLIIGDKADEIKITTFHAFSYETVRDNYEDLGFKKQPVVIDNISRYPLIEKILNQNPIFQWTGKAFLKFDAVTSGGGRRGALLVTSEIFNQIKTLKQEGNTSVAVGDIAFDQNEIPSTAVVQLIGLYDVYETLCQQLGYIDFDDMQYYGLKAIEENSGYLDEKYDFKHIIIDEFQDTSLEQMEIVKHLITGENFESLMVVGDDAQSIYAFRGTSTEFLQNFETFINSDIIIDGFKIPRRNKIVVKDILLDKNFRSGQTILDWAGKLLAYNSENIEKDVIGARGINGTIHMNVCDSNKEEMKEIVEEMKENHENGVSFDDMVAIAFTKNELKEVANLLTKEGIPSTFAAPMKMTENSRIQAILAFAKAYERNSDDISDADVAIAANAIYRAENVDTDVPFLKLSKDEIELRCKEVVDIIKEINEKSDWDPEKKQLFMDYINRISIGDEAVEHFTDMLEYKFEDVLKYCRDFVKYGEAEEFRSSAMGDGVKLITAHSSKGLEWKQVYLLLNGFDKSFARESEECRRTLYVSMTRAKDDLFVYGVNETTNSKFGTPQCSRTVKEVKEALEDLRKVTA